MKNFASITCVAAAVVFSSCKDPVSKNEKKLLAMQSGTTVMTAIGEVTLPPPYETKSATKRNSIVDWPEGKMPVAPEGFTVSRFAEDIKARTTYLADNGDIFACESEKGQITVFRDKDKNGKYETRQVFIKGLDKPFGMLVMKDAFYIANTGGLYKYPYSPGSLSLESKGTKILSLPAGGYNNHWTRNLLAGLDGSKIYVTVGSGSNVAEHGIENEIRRANILEINPDGTGEQIYASGLRNPVGMAWNPITKELWTAVNERDGLGDNLVPDYLTSVKRGAFYGWPYSYYGKIADPRMEGKGREMAAKAVIPDIPVGAHTASLGLAFDSNGQLPGKYKNGLFTGQHGSWNRSEISGYKVAFVPFVAGKPSGKAEDFLTGFVADAEKAEVYGRPVGVTILKDGSMLVCDDGSGTIWRVSIKK